MHIEISNGGMWCFHFCSRFSAQDRSQVIHVSKSQHSDPERVVEALLHSYHVSRGRGRSGIQMEGWMRSHGRFGMGRGGMHRRSSRSSCRRCSCSSSRQTPRQQSTCLQPYYKPHLHILQPFQTIIAIDTQATDLIACLAPHPMH